MKRLLSWTIALLLPALLVGVAPSPARTTGLDARRFERAAIVPPTVATPLPTGPVTAQPRVGAGASPAAQITLLRPPYVQDLTMTSLVIVWTTKENGASEVRYGTSGFDLSAAATSTLFTTPAAPPYDRYYVHQATLSGLAPNTVYQYRIFTGGADLTPGGTASARTAKPPTTDHFRFVAFGDTGIGSQNQLDVAARLFQLQPDLVVHTGDIVYPNGSYDGFETRYFQVYKDLLKSVWLAPSMGNHDYDYNRGKSFADVFVNPPNATSPAERELYYSFDYGNAHFVMLNNYFGISNTGSAQHTWLQNDLAASTRFWKFAVFHEPPYASGNDQQPLDNAYLVRYLVPLFEQYHVTMVLNGHEHWYERMKPLLDGQVSTIEAGGVVYIVTGGGGALLMGSASGQLNERTAAKAILHHLTMIDIAGCRLQLSAVQKVSGPGDTFDPSDVFDRYTIDRCASTAERRVYLPIVRR